MGKIKKLQLVRYARVNDIDRMYRERALGLLSYGTGPEQPISYIAMDLYTDTGLDSPIGWYEDHEREERDIGVIYLNVHLKWSTDTIPGKPFIDPYDSAVAYVDADVWEKILRRYAVRMKTYEQTRSAEEQRAMMAWRNTTDGGRKQILRHLGLSENYYDLSWLDMTEGLRGRLTHYFTTQGSQSLTEKFGF